MLFVLLDAVVLCGLIYLVNSGDSPSFGAAVWPAFALTVVMALCAILLGPSMGLFALVPMAASAGLVLWAAFDIKPSRAALVGFLMFVYKIAMSFAILWLSGG